MKKKSCEQCLVISSSSPPSLSIVSHATTSWGGGQQEIRSFWVDAAHLAAVRRQTIHIYHEIFGTPDYMAHPNRLVEMIEQLVKAKSDLSKLVEASSISPTPTSIFTLIFESSVLESQILFSLLRAQIAISNLRFKDAMVELYQCKSALEAWELRFLRVAEDPRASAQVACV